MLMLTDQLAGQLAGSVSWFPQDCAHVFYVVKGVLGLLATVMLIVHMSHTWDRMVSLGQRLRYITLLAFSILVTGATLEQLQQDAGVNYRNLGAMVCVLLLVGAMLASLDEDVRRHRRR